MHPGVFVSQNRQLINFTKWSKQLLQFFFFPSFWYLSDEQFYCIVIFIRCTWACMYILTAAWLSMQTSSYISYARMQTIIFLFYCCATEANTSSTVTKQRETTQCPAIDPHFLQSVNTVLEKTSSWWKPPRQVIAATLVPTLVLFFKQP